MRKAICITKATAWITAFIFTLFSCLEFAPPNANANPSFTSSQILQPALIQKLVPNRFGEIEDQFIGKNSKFLIYIQDSHTSLEAQKNISFLIQHLIEEQGFNLVFEEGYEGEVPSDIYFTMKDPKLKQQVSYFFMDYLRLSAAEYAHINRTKNFTLIGVDRLHLYLENVRQYKKAARSSSIVKHDLEKIETELEKLEPKLFPKSFFSWWKLQKRFDSGTLSFEDFLRRTLHFYELETQSKLADHKKQYPNLFILQSLMQKKSLKVDEKLMREEFDQLNMAEVFNELMRLKNEIAAVMLPSFDARQLFSYLDSVGILRRLASLEVTQEEFESYSRRVSKLKTSAILDFLSRHSGKSFVLPDLWEEWITEMRHFYRIAHSREAALDETLSGDWQNAVLVFGGFHKKGILKTLQKRGISYVVVAPRVTNEDPLHEERYRKLMQGQHYAFERAGKVPQAVRSPSLYVYDRPENVLLLVDEIARDLQRSEVRSTSLENEQVPELDLQDMSLNDSVQTVAVEDHLLFEGDDFLQSVDRFWRLLDILKKQNLRTELIEAYLVYLEKAEIHDLPIFFEKLISALAQIEPEYVKLETFIEILKAIEKKGNAQFKEELKRTLTKIKTDRQGRRLIRAVFDSLHWGLTPHHSFFYEDVVIPAFEDVFSEKRLSKINGAEILRRLQIQSEMSVEEISVLIKHLFPEKSPEAFTVDEWKQVYAALVYENHFIQESKIAGFRRVHGIRRLDKVSSRRVLGGKSSEMIDRIAGVFGYSQDALEKMILEEWGEGKNLESLSDQQWLMIQERLHRAGKKRFEHLDRHRYKKDQGIFKRLFTKPTLYFQALRDRGIMGFLFSIVNDLLSLMLEIFVRWPVHLLEVFFFGYYRTEILYEHLYKNQDFLGQTHSESIIRHALRDFRDNRIRLSDRLAKGVFGVLNRVLDSFFMGSIFKATLRFLIRRIHLAIISAIAMGALATLGVPILSAGWIVSSASLALATSGMVGLGSVFSYLSVMPIIGSLSVPLTIGNIGQSIVVAAALVAPRFFIARYQQRKRTDPKMRWFLRASLVLFKDMMFSLSFWKNIFVTTVGMLLIGAEISAIVQYAAAIDLLIAGENKEIDMTPFNNPEESRFPLHAFITGKVRVEGIDHELQGPLFTRAAGLVEGDALHWGNHLLDVAQDGLSFNLSDWVFHHLGGNENLRAHEVIHAAHVLAQARMKLVLDATNQEHLRDFEQTAAILTTLSDQGQPKQSAVAFELLHRKPEDSVLILQAMDYEHVGRIGREYAKSEFQRQNLQIDVLGKILSETAPTKAIAFQLAHQTAKIEFEDNVPNQEKWVKTFQQIADSDGAQSKEALRAVATVLDNLEPKQMAELLKKAGRTEFIQHIFDEAPLVNVARKDRLVQLMRELGLRELANEKPKAGGPFQGKIDEKTRQSLRSLLNIERKRDALQSKVTKISESADAIHALIKYAVESGDQNAIQELGKKYEWLKTKQQQNGSMLAGQISGMRPGGEVSNGAVKLLPVQNRDTAGKNVWDIEIHEDDKSPRAGFAVRVDEVLRNEKTISISHDTPKSTISNDQNSAVYERHLSNDQVKIEWQDSVESKRHASRHKGVLTVNEDGNYLTKVRFDWLPSHQGQNREDSATKIWFPEKNEMIDIRAINKPGLIDITADLKAGGKIVFYGFDKALVLRLPGDSEKIEKVIVRTKRSEDGQVIIDDIQWIFRFQNVKKGDSIQIPEVQAVSMWVPLASSPKQLGGDGDGIPDDLKQLVPAWLKMMDRQRGDEFIYRTDSNYAAAGTDFFRFSEFFQQLASQAQTKGRSQEFEQYSRLSNEAKERGLKTTAYAYRIFRALVNQNEAARSYAYGHNYPDMVELFDEAYEATGDRKWYEALQHVSENMYQNQVTYLKKVMPEYEDREVTKYFIAQNGELVDLFKAINLGDPRFRFAITRGKLPDFNVGYNEELQQNIRENQLDVIHRIIVHDDAGKYLDTLHFRYDDKGVLTTIESEQGSIQTKKETIPTVKKVQVYQQDVKTKIPYGMVYEYVYNAAGQVQYIVKKERVTIKEHIQRHPINVLLKDASGRALMDLDIPQGLRPDHGNFRTNEELNAEKDFGVLGRTLHMLYRVNQRAETEKDWELASRAERSASTAILSFYDAFGKVFRDQDKLFFLYDQLPEKGENLKKYKADALGQAQLLLGLAPWSGKYEQAEELYRKGTEYFEIQAVKDSNIAALLALAKIHHGKLASNGDEFEIPEGLAQEALKGFERYIRYGKNTTNFKFAKIKTRRFQLESDHADAVFLHWEPIAQAMWYLVKEYRQAADGRWKVIERNDRWVGGTFLALEDPTEIKKRYVVIGFTADPIFESYGPYHGARSFASEPVEATREKEIKGPGQPQLVLPIRHQVGSHEEWIDLNDTYEIVAREMKRFPHARGSEWEISTDKHFKNVVHKFKTETEIPSLFLRGLPDGHYYVRVRLWSNSREVLKHDWIDISNRSVQFKNVPKPVVNEDLNKNGLHDQNEPDLNWNGVLDRVYVRDESVIAWTAPRNAKLYRVKIGYKEGDMHRFVHDEIITLNPFLNVHEYTVRPVNWIEVIPYMAHPEMGGIAGSPSGRIDIPEISGMKEPVELKDVNISKPAGEIPFIHWSKLPKAKIYRVETLSRGLRDRQTSEFFWVPEFAMRYELQRSAKFARVQAWSDHPSKGGKPLSEYSPWLKVDTELNMPESIRRESIVVKNTQTGTGETSLLSFERIEGVAGYYVTTQNHRGGAYLYWVPQSPSGENPSVQLVMDADQVKVQTTTARVHGTLGLPITERIKADVPHSNEVVDFQIIRETKGSDLNKNGRIDPTYFFYDLKKIPADGMRVYIQYATQYQNREEIVHPFTNGSYFYPRQNVDRVKARIVRFADDGAMIVSDWSEWKDTQIRVATPPNIVAVKQDGRRAVKIQEPQISAPVSKKIVGYKWETRFDLNDPSDDAISYGTRVKLHNGKVYDLGTKLEVAKNARWVRAKALLQDDHGEIESEDWSEWQSIHVQIDSPSKVEHIRLEGTRKIIFDPHKDEKVNAYKIEISDDPYSPLAHNETYIRRIIREQSAKEFGKSSVARPNNFLEIPKNARYIRVTPLIINHDDDQIVGEASSWIPVKIQGTDVLPRMDQPKNHGLVIIGKPVAGANYYRIETQDNSGATREYLSRTPSFQATGTFVNYRIQPIRAREVSGELIVEVEGEWTPRVVVPEPIIHRLPTPENLRLGEMDGRKILLRWDSTLNRVMDYLGNIKYSYQIELEDQYGNRVSGGEVTADRFQLPFPVVKARVKILKHTFTRVEAESDWSPWLEIKSGSDVIQTPPLKLSVNKINGYYYVDIEGRSTYYEIEKTYVNGAQTSITLSDAELRKLHHRLKIPESSDLVRIRARAVWYSKPPAGQRYQKRIVETSPWYEYSTVYVSGNQKIERIEIPSITKVEYEKSGRINLEWKEVPVTNVGRRMVYRIFGIDGAGEKYYFPKSKYASTSLKIGPNDIKSGIRYIGVEAREMDVQAYGTIFDTSPMSNLIPVEPEISESTPQDVPIAVTPEIADVVSWQPAAYHIVIREKDHPEKSPVIVISEHDYPPNSVMPRGREAYEIDAQEIIAYEVILKDRTGHERILRTTRNFVNLGDFPAANYASIKVRYVTQSDFRGVHSDWSKARALNVRHPQPILYIRPVSEEHLSVVFRDGVKVFFSRKDKSMIYALVPSDSGEKKITAREIPEKYRLKPENVFESGERWETIATNDLNRFYELTYRLRHVMQNNSWRVTIPSYLDEKPVYLLGINSTGTFYLQDSSTRKGAIVRNESFVLGSKSYENTNPGALEAKWSSGSTGVGVYTKKYLIEGEKVGVLQLSVDKHNSNKVEEFVLALRIAPDVSTGQASVKKVGDYKVFHFGNGQFVSVHRKDLEGWYLGADAQNAERNPKLQNNLTQYEGPVENAVLYIRGKATRFASDQRVSAAFKSKSGEQLNSIFIFSGEAKDTDVAKTVRNAVKYVNDYEKAFESFARHASRSGKFPQEVIDLFFLKQLSNTAWRSLQEGIGTYWEMIGMNDRGPANALWTNASWTGNSSLMQQLNIRMHHLLTGRQGHDRINDRGESLLRDRILPNAEWISSNMQTPTDSFYMKIGDAIRLLYSEGHVLMDNQLMSAIVSMRRGIPVMRGYEPLDAFTIAGSGFEIGSESSKRYYDLRSSDFDFRLLLPEDARIDPAQPEINSTRVYNEKHGLFNTHEKIQLKKGEYGLRYSLELEAKQALQLKKVSVALSHLDADQNMERNPEGFPGFQGGNGLFIPGVSGVFRARELFERGGHSPRIKGQWVDLLSLLEESGVRTPKGEAVRKALKEIGAIGMLGWDKGGVMYLKEGIDYDRGYRVMVKINEREDDEDEDHLLEFTDLRIEIPVNEANQQIKPGQRYVSPTVYMTNFWVRLAVTDHDNLPEDLKHMALDWIQKIDQDKADSLSMESDYGYTESVIALWNTANLMIDEMLQAEKEGRDKDIDRYKKLAAKYAAAAMRATLASRDADKSVYDIETGAVRSDVMNSKGVMRFYGTYTVIYGMARDFMARAEQLASQDSKHAIFLNDRSEKISVYEALIHEAETQADRYLDSMRQSKNPKDYARNRIYFEIYWAKAAKFRALALGQEKLKAEIAKVGEELIHEKDEFTRLKKYLFLHYAKKQLNFERVLQKYASGLTYPDYWTLEILWSADRILSLQEKNPNWPNYGGFYQNEQPSKMQLDDNGTKLWALRVAYEKVDKRIQEILSTPGLRTQNLSELAKLYQLRRSYIEAAQLNIQNWVRIDERDGHLFGWESDLREQDYDSQRTEYGNGMYRYHGLGSWMDLIPEAVKKFDLSSRQHQEERPDGSRNFSPRGFKMYISYENPGNGNDASTEIAPTELMAYLTRAEGGSFNKQPLSVHLAKDEDKPAAIIIERNYFSKLVSWKEFVVALQLAVEANFLVKLFVYLFRTLKQSWHRIGSKLRNYRFASYNFAILAITGALGYWYVSLHDLEKTHLPVLTLMAAFSFYVMKNVAETVVRYFKIGMILSRERLKGNVQLEYGPFRQTLPMHLTTLLSVPLYTTDEKDARVSHGEVNDNTGAFHNAVMKNLSGEPGLFFHLNDQSPDRVNGGGFNPKEYHEAYVKHMIERYGRRFVYTHQSGNTEKKLGAVQASDAWWYAFRTSIAAVNDDLWESLTVEQKKELKRIAYGVTERILALPEGVYRSSATGLEVKTHKNGTITLEFKGAVSKPVTLPEREGEEIQIQIRAKRKDGMTALLPFWISKVAGGFSIYHFNENPEGDHVLIVETLNRTSPTKIGLLPLEKEAMIEEETRALLYRFWASEYGGTRGGSDVTENQANLLVEQSRRSVLEIFVRSGTSAEQVFGWDPVHGTVPGGFADRFSLAMVHQSANYFDRAGEILKQLNVSNLNDLFPQAFDENIHTWTDTALLNGNFDSVQTVPFELEVGKRAMPGSYYHLNPETGKLEPYENPALRIIDETTRMFESLREDSKLSLYAKKRKAEEYLSLANPILKRIREITPVLKHYLVRTNPANGQTEVLEEQWIMYEYIYEDGHAEIFFRPERKVRFDVLVGHLPSVGPVSYVWRFDNDTTVDLEDGERNTLIEGVMRAGHPDYQPVLDAKSGQTVAGYGGMVLPLRVGNSDASLWAEVEARNRDRATWDLEGQWQGFGEAQYTGKGIENLISSDRSKTHAMPKGFYLSHDMLEAGYSGPGTLNMELRRKLAERGLLEAFLEGTGNPKFNEALNLVVDNFSSEDGRLLMTKYGRPITTEELRELLSYGDRAGGMGLLSGLWGYEDYFTSHSDTLFKVMGQWKKGDYQWWHASWLGLDVRGRQKLPGAMPGYTISERRTLEQSIGVEDGNIVRRVVGQDYKPNPLTNVQKYFLARTVEEDQRGAIMFVWLIASLILTALNHNVYKLLNFPVLSYFLLVGSLLFIVGIMKFSSVFRNMRRDGLTIGNAKEFGYAIADTLLESIVVSGINLWKALVSTIRLIFRAPSMKWVTGAQLGERQNFTRAVWEYGIGILLGFSLIGFIIALHPTWAWLTFGSLFLGSLTLGPLFAWMVAKNPAEARLNILRLAFVVGLGFGAVLLLPALGVSHTETGQFLMLAGFYAGKAAFIGLAAIAVIRIVSRLLPVLYRHATYVLLHLARWAFMVLVWIKELILLDPTLAIINPIKQSFGALFQIQSRLSGASLRDYFLTRGQDLSGYLSSRYKALGNLIVIGFLWSLPLLFPEIFITATFGNFAASIVVSAFYLGLFFPSGFMLIDHILSPERPFRWIQPLDYLRAVFNLVSGITGYAVGFLIHLTRWAFSVVRASYNQGIAHQFLKRSARALQNPEGKKIVRQTAQVLNYSTQGYRRKFLNQMLISPEPNQKFLLLANSGMLDDQVLKELSEALFVPRENHNQNVEQDQGNVRSEIRTVAQPVLKKQKIDKKGAFLPDSKNIFVQTNPTVELIKMIQEVKGAVMIDARDLMRFSPDQQDEVIKVALSGRASIVIYHRDLVKAQELVPFLRVSRIHIIPEGIERAVFLLSGYRQVVHLFTKDYDPRKNEGFARSHASLKFKRKLYQQIETGEEGILTVALLTTQYGDKLHYFREENGAHILIDMSVLKVIHDFLAHELISQAA